MPIQDGSVYLESRIEGVIVVMEAFADAVSARPPLGVELAVHTAKQIEALRALVKDGTFQTYDHWWRSPSYSKTIYDKNEEIAFVRDLTLEAKIDRSDGSLDLHLAGWATDFKTHNSFGRVSMAGA